VTQAGFLRSSKKKPGKKEGKDNEHPVYTLGTYCHAPGAEATETYVEKVLKTVVGLPVGIIQEPGATGGSKAGKCRGKGYRGKKEEKKTP